MGTIAHSSIGITVVSNKSIIQTNDLFNRFLETREGKSAKHMAAAQLTDIPTFISWLDACGKPRRTVLHDIYREAVGTGTLLECCKYERLCGKGVARDFLRTKLRV